MHLTQTHRFFLLLVGEEEVSEWEREGVVDEEKKNKLRNILIWKKTSQPKLIYAIFSVFVEWVSTAMHEYFAQNTCWLSLELWKMDPRGAIIALECFKEIDKRKDTESFQQIRFLIPILARMFWSHLFAKVFVVLKASSRHSALTPSQKKVLGPENFPQNHAQNVRSWPTSGLGGFFEFCHFHGKIFTNFTHCDNFQNFRSLREQWKTAHTWHISAQKLWITSVLTTKPSVT